VCGHPVFAGQSTMEVCAKHLRDEPAPPSQYLPVPVDLEALILACLEKDPANRPTNAVELQRQLLRCEAAESWSQSRALAWWQEHDEAVRRQLERNRALLSTSHDTVLIDLEGRARGRRTPPVPDFEETRLDEDGPGPD